MSMMYIFIGFLVGSVIGAIATYVSVRHKSSVAMDIRCATLSEQLAGKIERIAELAGQLQSRDQELRSLHAEISKLNADKSALLTAIEKDHENASEKIRLITESEERLKQEFEMLANRIFDEKGRRFSDQSRETIANLVNPLREQLGEFRRRVDDVYGRESEQRFSLIDEIKRLKELNKQIGQDAANLTNALKGDSKTQGNWGELKLEKLLEDSGLENGREYETQCHLQNVSEPGKTRRPDAIIHLPEERDVIIDAKVSLTAYEKYCSAENEEQRAAFLKDHILSVSRHVAQLSEKNYEGLDGVRSLDFVLMFVPVESAFLCALKNNPDLFQDAFNNNIVMVCPSTLLMTLRIIANMWRREYQNRNAIAIAERARLLYEKFVNFIDKMQEIGAKLAAANEAYGKAYGLLTEGKGNLVWQAEKLIDMGVKARKKIPVGIIEQASADDAEDPATDE